MHTFTPFRVMDIQFPIARFASVADATSNPVLALAQLAACVSSTAPKRVARHFFCSCWVAAAL